MSEMAVVYSLVSAQNVWFIHSPNGTIETPGGMPLGSSSKEIALQTIDDLNAYGPDPSEHWSIYGLLCSYMDFASLKDRSKLTEAIISELEGDPIYNQLMPEEPFRSFLARIGWCCGTRKEQMEAWGDESIAPARHAFRKHLESCSLKGLAALSYGCAHFHAPLTLAALLDDKSRVVAARELFAKSGMVVWPFNPRYFDTEMTNFCKVAESEDDREMLLEAYRKRRSFEK